MTASVSLSDVRLTDPDLFVQGVPHDIFWLLRREAPVHWSEGTERFPGFWSITRYDDIIALSRDPMTFISGKGIAMHTNPDDPVQAASLGKMMIVTDPPRHVRLRRLVNKCYTPRMVGALAGAVREVVTQIIDDVAAKGSCDFVIDIAARLPLASTASA